MHERRPSLARDPWAVVVIACTIGFLVVAAVVNGQGHVGLDQPVIDAWQGLPVPVGAWEAITTLGGLFLVAVGAAIVVALVALGRLRFAIVVAFALIAASLFTEATKLFVGRPRPEAPLVPAPGYSFPSGHTLNSTVTYGIAALLVWRSRLSPAIRNIAVAGLVAPIVAVGLSRIALGVHYPSDVLAGWLAGSAIVAIVALADRADRARAREPRRRR